MTYRIFGDRISGNCHKVRWTADLLGLDYDWVETDVLKRETRTPEFLALNPAGQVPLVVTPEGLPLAQSNAIILHLNERHKGALAPTDAFERAKMYEWLFWEQYNHEPYVAVRRFHKHYLGKSDADIDPKLKERGDAALALMDRRLSDRQYFIGDRLTLADISLLAYTRLAPEGGFRLEEFPAVTRWISDAEQAIGI